MKFPILIILCFMVVMTSGQDKLSSPSNQLFFKHLSVEEGLSQPTVNAIMKSSRGFIWIATEDGLNRYDGSKFRIFRHNVNDTTTISHSVVYALVEDSVNNNIYVGTANGLCSYNRFKDTFTRFSAQNTPGSAYSSLAMDYAQKILWIANGAGGVRYLDIEKGSMHNLTHPDLQDIVAWAICLKGNNVYIGTIGKGLKVYNTVSKTVTTYDASTPKQCGNEIRSLLTTDDGLWIGSQGEGLYYLSYGDNSIQKHTFQLNPASRGIWSLALDHNKNLWVGTDGSGLVVYNPSNNEFQNYSYSDRDQHGLNDNTIRSILIESNGDAWLGTYVGGINYHPELPLKFKLYKKENGNPLSLSDPSVMSFAQGDDKLWIGTDNGLNYMKDEVIHRYGKIVPSEQAEVILSLLHDKKGGLWIGTYDQGLFYLDKKNKLTRYVFNLHDKTSISDNTVWDLAEDSLGYIWVGTDNGVNRLNPVTREFESNRNSPGGNITDIFDRMGVRTLLVTRDGSLWVGFYGDLAHYSYKEDKVTRYTNIQDGNRKIESVRVISLCEDRNQNIWVGTYGDGLCRYDTATKKFSIIDREEGLPNDFILAIHSGVADDLWMSTNVGIVYYNVQERTSFTFDQNYGVQSNTFNRGASIRLTDGTLAFGGVRGFNMFTPTTINTAVTNLPVRITDFKIFNESIRPGSRFLPVSITESAKIELPFDHSRLISFQYSALHFVSPGQVRFNYKLENFSKEWQDEGNGHTVTFTSLEPGSYRLVIRASLNEQNWGQEKSLAIVIHPPWYRTFGARVIGITLIGLGIFALYRLRTRRLHDQKKMLETLVKEQSKEIKNQNDELAAQNEELMQRNEEMATQRELMADQNKILSETQRQMAELNQSLEKLVEERTQDLDNTIHQLNKTIRELDAFVYSASHDLIAPLKSVLGLIQLARKGNEENVELVTYLDYMEMSIKKLDEIIKNMIQFSRNSKLEIKKEVLSIRTEVEECIQDFQFMKGFNEIDFQININPNAQIISDKQRLRIILANLIGNSIKYSDPSKSSHEVSIKYENGNSTWRLSIHDNGIGIDKKYLSRVFEMFYRGTDRAYGSGLGLYIVKETVDRLSGEVFVDSEKGNWTRFELIFPVEHP